MKDCTTQKQGRGGLDSKFLLKKKILSLFCWSYLFFFLWSFSFQLILLYLLKASSLVRMKGQTQSPTGTRVASLRSQGAGNIPWQTQGAQLYSFLAIYQLLCVCVCEGASEHPQTHGDRRRIKPRVSHMPSTHCPSQLPPQLTTFFFLMWVNFNL